MLIYKRLSGENGHEAGRQLLAQLYHQATGAPLPPICVTERGKPYLTDSEWHFSISHTENHVFCALSRRPVGIDAEEMDRQIDPKLAQRILSPSEAARFDGSREMLLRFWVLKEAYAKLTGRGLGNYLQQTDLRPETVEQIDGCFVAVLEEKP